MATPALDRRQFIAAAMPAMVWWQAGCAMPRDSAAPKEIRLSPVPAQARLDSGAPAVAVWAYGGTVPGPEIRVRQGERLRVLVQNALPQETTVHWHGVRVPHAMDGVPHLTQPPIAPGESFVYDFVPPDAGTYWYHSHLHSAEQLERGLAGVLVVEEREPPPVDRDLVWVLDDWRLTRQGQISGGFDDAHDMSHAGRLGNVVTLNGAGEPPDLVLRPNERIRLRLLNAANARIFGLRFEGHSPRIIALDGQPVAPHVPTDGRVVLAPGMRCDLLLDGTGQPGQRHAVRDDFYPRQTYELVHLAYQGPPVRPAPPATAIVLPPNPLPEPDLARAETHEIVFEGGMMGQLHQALLDGRPMNMMGLLRHGKAWSVNGVAAQGHAMQPVVTLQHGRSYVLALRNETRWHHPIHLHGHSFRVIRRNGRATALREWQDTVLMDPMERVDIAFVADNPGDWMMHCHILEHQDGGMMAVFRVR